jgi:hypothetical protein
MGDGTGIHTQTEVRPHSLCVQQTSLITTNLVPHLGTLPRDSTISHCMCLVHSSLVMVHKPLLASHGVLDTSKCCVTFLFMLAALSNCNCHSCRFPFIYRYCANGNRQSPTTRPLVWDLVHRTCNEPPANGCALPLPPKPVHALFNGLLHSARQAQIFNLPSLKSGRDQCKQFVCVRGTVSLQKRGSMSAHVSHKNEPAYEIQSG